GLSLPTRRARMSEPGHPRRPGSLSIFSLDSGPGLGLLRLLRLRAAELRPRAALAVAGLGLGLARALGLLLTLLDPQFVLHVLDAPDPVGEILGVALGPAAVDRARQGDVALLNLDGHLAGIDVLGV